MKWENIKIWLANFGKTTGLSILKALAVLVVGIIIIKIVMRILKSAFKKSKMEKITQSFLLSILKFALYMILLILTMQQLGISTTWLVALLTAASLAIGLSLQGSLSNLANGIVIITTKPFHEGDFVNINGVEGKVKNIKMLTTAIITLDNKLIVIPNSTIVSSNIINYNILGKRRVDFTFDVAYESDVKKVENIIKDVMFSNGKVYTDPAPFVSLKFLQNSSIQFVANCWCDAEDYADVLCYVMNNVFNEFKKANISIPYEQLEVRLREDKIKMPVVKDLKLKRIEKERKQEDKNFLQEVGEILTFKKIKKANKKVKNDKKDIKQIIEQKETKSNKQKTRKTNKK